MVFPQLGQLHAENCWELAGRNCTLNVVFVVWETVMTATGWPVSSRTATWARASDSTLESAASSSYSMYTLISIARSRAESAAMSMLPVLLASAQSYRNLFSRDILRTSFVGCGAIRAAYFLWLAVAAGTDMC